ncbi:MAG: N-formylglutamate amidohydrolase [Bacteroidetes bacterium]|nr:N-formylglutamate amidohydrolase [Bacteroidota bacterium]
MPEPFQLIRPVTTEVPVLLSIPHCGTEFPEDLKDEFDPNLMRSPDDTDWFVDRLYDFAPSMGITMISARYSRWVIDLNRDPQSKPLYSDGRLITGLCPVTTFLGEPLYNDKRKEITTSEIQRRIEVYYRPYHEKIQSQLTTLKERFGSVLLWDCHSIRQVVPTISKEKFPDLILGDADGTSASPGIIETILSTLDHSRYHVRHNHPFKGGQITRHFGKPTERQHAVQLEMTKVNYMKDDELRYDEARASEMRMLLKKVLEKLINTL